MGVRLGPTERSLNLNADVYDDVIRCVWWCDIRRGRWTWMQLSLEGQRGCCLCYIKGEGEWSLLRSYSRNKFRATVKINYFRAKVKTNFAEGNSSVTQLYATAKLQVCSVDAHRHSDTYFSVLQSDTKAFRRLAAQATWSTFTFTVVKMNFYFRTTVMFIFTVVEIYF